jgi:hypothetical protein
MQTAATTSQFGGLRPMFPEATRINTNRTFQISRFQTGVAGAFDTAGTLNTNESVNIPMIFLRKT